MQRMMICAMTMCLSPMAMFGQATTANPLSAEVQARYEQVKGFVIKAAENMPAENYSYKPTPDIRSFARVVNHVTEAQFHSCGALNGATEAKPTPPETADKTTIVNALKASFAECDKAFGALTDAHLAEMMDIGGRKRSQMGLAWGTVSHDNEQYATLALYMRLKGLTPPSSEK